MEWKNLFPGSKVTCENITKDPWSLLTISDMFCQEKTNKEEKEEYVTYYRAILWSLPGPATSYQPIISPRIVSVQRLRDETERLYKLAKDMLNIIEAHGQI